MKNNKELKLLEDVLEKISTDKKSIILRGWFSPILWLICTLMIIVLLKVHDILNNPVIIIFTSAALGIIVGIVSFLQIAEKNWPIIKRHINTESVRKRIDEIST